MNNERPTPETDAYLASLEDHAYCDVYGVHHLDAEFARKLERERNSLWELHNKNAARSAELLELCNTLRKERDEALKQCVELKAMREAIKEADTLLSAIGYLKKDMARSKLQPFLND